jgi:hypothetical protein
MARCVARIIVTATTGVTYGPDSISPTQTLAAAVAWFKH